MPNVAANSSPSLRSNSRPARIDLRLAIGFALLVVAGGLGVIYPMVWIVCLTAAVALAVFWGLFRVLGKLGLEKWQLAALTTFSGYMLLNYGYDNLAIHIGGFPILIGYGLAYLAFVGAVYSRRRFIGEALREPALLCVLALLLLAAGHLVTDIPSYGSWAFRDGTMCFDGLFLLVGLLWARKAGSFEVVAKWLLLVFAILMFYGLTLPWHESLFSWSPVSGVYYEVPLLGNYRGTGDWLLAGALFCICVGGYVRKRPTWLMPALAVGMLLGIAVTQVRRAYLAIVVAIVILILAGEAKKFARLFIMVPLALVIVFAVTGWGGLEVSGRIGKISPQFFIDHLRSIGGAEDTPGSDPMTRVRMASEAYQHFLSHPIFGEGFGRPVVEEYDWETDSWTRTPHNSTITYLARLGAVGELMWVAFHVCLWIRFYYAFRQRRSADRRIYSFVLWSFLFYVLFMMSSLVESPFEYPAEAILFYFLIGFSLGLTRWQLLPKNRSNRPLAEVPVKVARAQV
jgi:O-antigen ligase